MFAVAFFFGCWSLTSVLGTRDVTEHLAQLIVAVEPSGGDSRRVERDPIANNLEEEYGIPCHYAGHASSPFPLIVAVDWAKVIYVPYGDGIRTGPGDPFHGESGRATFLWLFGLRLELTHWNRAGTTVIGGPDLADFAVRSLSRITFDEDLLELLLYVLELHGPGTRLSVMRNPSTQSARDAKRKAGVYYTPADVAEYMARELLSAVQSPGDMRYLDPSCGTGVYFVALLNVASKAARR